MQNKITPRLIKLCRLLSDMTMEQVVQKYNVSYYQLKKIEKNLNMDLYVDENMSVKVINALEKFVDESGVQFFNDGIFTAIYFANDGSNKKYQHTEANDNLIKLHKKLDSLKKEKSDLANEAQIELSKLQEKINDIKNQCDYLTKDIDSKSFNFSKKIS